MIFHTLNVQFIVVITMYMYIYTITTIIITTTTITTSVRSVNSVVPNVFILVLGNLDGRRRMRRCESERERERASEAALHSYVLPAVFTRGLDSLLLLLIESYAFDFVVT